jgi:hypothetical protein
MEEDGCTWIRRKSGTEGGAEWAKGSRPCNAWDMGTDAQDLSHHYRNLTNFRRPEAHENRIVLTEVR